MAQLAWAASLLKGKTPTTSVLLTTLNNPLVRL